MVERWTRDAQGFVKWQDGEWVRYSDHESELATLRARVEELEREVNALLSNAAAKGDEPDLLLTEWKEAKARAERAEEAFEIANNMRLEATRLAVEALEPLLLEIDAGIDPLDSRHDRANYNRARTALDRLTNIMGESDG